MRPSPMISTARIAHVGRRRGRWGFLGVLVAIIAALGWGRAAAEIPPPKHSIGEVRFENDGTWFTLAIPTQAAWAHWTLANPPRIIVDLSDAISVLPNAPGLYEVEMDRGPVRRFRTSQFSNTPLDRRVRITLELSAITPYEARRVGEEIHILVESPGVEAAPARLTSGGLEAGGRKASPPPVRKEDQAEAIAAPPPSSVDSAVPATSPVRSAPTRPSPEDLAVSDPVPMPPSADPRGPKPTESARAGESTRADDHASHAGGNRSDAGAPDDEAAGEELPPEDEPVDDPYARDLRDRPEIRDEDIAQMKSTLEQLLGTRNVDEVTETSRGEVLSDEELRARVREEEFAEEEWEDWEEFDEASGLESPDSLRARRASALLQAAVSDWLRGDLAGAEKRADRCRRYYGDYPGGIQAALLLRETYQMTGREALAAGVRGVPEIPDTSYFGPAFFQRLLTGYYEGGDDARLLDRLEYWGPLYPETGLYARYHYLLGREAYNAGDAPRAEEHLGRLSLYDDGGDAAYLMRARLADEAGRTDDALVLYRELAFSTSGPFALRGLVRAADLEFQAGEVEAAKEIYRAILEHPEVPTDERAWALYQAGSCALLTGDARAAKSAYETLVAELPAAHWAGVARERLAALAWEGDVARRVGELRNP